MGEEFEGVELGDKRRSDRLVRLAALMDAGVGLGLPRATGNGAELEAAYRLLGNEAVNYGAVLEPHISKTAKRVGGEELAYVIHDTSELRFGGEAREGLGWLQGNGRGFLAHVSLAISADEEPMPLGVLSFQPLVRAEPKKKKKRTRTEARNEPQSESRKWLKGVDAAAAKLSGASVVHLMDREADIYDLVATLRARGQRFVIRVGQDRALQDEGLLFERLENAPTRFRRSVRLSRRPRGTKQNPAREARVADLSFSTACLELKRPASACSDLPESLKLKFVHVVEDEAPEGEAPVDWKLVTTEPTKTTADVERIVDAYRKRWVIEEFFKALKTGCGVQKTQLESLPAVLNYVAIQLPIATRLLALRSHDRRAPTAPATTLLSSSELAALELMAPKPLGPRPTIHEALWAIASLGGHIKNNGDPGWQVIGRGFEDLLRYTEMYERLVSKSDQS